MTGLRQTLLQRLHLLHQPHHQSLHVPIGYSART
jgi:hypothetical protein